MTPQEEAEEMAWKLAKAQREALRLSESKMINANGNGVDYLFWDNCRVPLAETLLKEIPLAQYIAVARAANDLVKAQGHAAQINYANTRSLQQRIQLAINSATAPLHKEIERLRGEVEKAVEVLTEIAQEHHTTFREVGDIGYSDGLYLKPDLFKKVKAVIDNSRAKRVAEGKE